MKVKHAQKSGRGRFCISLKINACSSLWAWLSSQQSYPFYLEKCFKQLLPSWKSEGLGNIKDPFRSALMTLLHSIKLSLSFTDNRDISNFQKSPSNSGKMCRNFIFLLIDTSLSLADGYVEETAMGGKAEAHPRGRGHGSRGWKMGTGSCSGQEFIVRIVSKCNSKWDPCLLLTNSPCKRLCEEDST